MANDEADKIAGAGLAAGAVVAALLEVLHSKGALTLDESRNILDMAMRAVAPHMRNPAGFEASQIIGALQRGRFSARG